MSPDSCSPDVEDQAGHVTVEEPPIRRLEVCIWCINRDRERCQTECQPEGKYRYLEPKTLPDWERPPSLPVFRKLVDWEPAARLAILYLVTYYLDWQSKRE